MLVMIVNFLFDIYKFLDTESSLILFYIYLATGSLLLMQKLCILEDWSQSPTSGFYLNSPTETHKAAKGEFGLLLMIQLAATLVRELTSWNISFLACQCQHQWFIQMTTRCLTLSWKQCPAVLADPLLCTPSWTAPHCFRLLVGWITPIQLLTHCTTFLSLHTFTYLLIIAFYFPFKNKLL